jgi:hypothetical protein
MVCTQKDNEEFLSSFSNFQGDLCPEQIERYSRQLLLHGGFGVKGQLKLLKASVLVVGAGGIGSTGTVSAKKKQGCAVHSGSVWWCFD